MPDLSLDLRYLRYAILVAEHGSVRRTADILNIRQSTVSRRIQLLERRIGVQLFERSRSGARTTLAGERFLREAAVGAEHLREAVNGLTLARRGHFGGLRIGLMASLASGFLADLHGAYHSRFPGIEIKLDEATSQVNASAVLNGRLDAAFIPGERDPSKRHPCVEPLHELAGKLGCHSGRDVYPLPSGRATLLMRTIAPTCDGLSSSTLLVPRPVGFKM
ncbi:LysR family transcriptional regulator [Bradyrhizobium sp. JR4.1]|uniref:LysR family transcriptional regulator n=1 Tax=Bradyrhizobium sp. JR4.1 TaxID=3156372 RepID=UPI003391BC8B